MTSRDEQRTEKAFQRHLETTVDYFAAVVDNGGEPWFKNPDKLARLERHIPGISQMPPEERRRALFMRHRKTKEN